MNIISFRIIYEQQYIDANIVKMNFYILLFINREKCCGYGVVFEKKILHQNILKKNNELHGILKEAIVAYVVAVVLEVAVGLG